MSENSDEPSLRESPALMDDHRAHIILGQSVAGTSDMCRFEDDSRTVFIRRDGVLKAMRNAASYAAEQLAGFCGVVPSRELLRSLDHGAATAPEQLEAAARLRLMNAPAAMFSGLRITIEAPTIGNVSLHVQGFNMLGTQTQRLLDAALSSLTAEIDDFRHCPHHSPGNRKDGSSPQNQGAA
jgi:hypothetical protein